jgi:hypothetical protein
MRERAREVDGHGPKQVQILAPGHALAPWRAIALAHLGIKRRPAPSFEDGLGPFPRGWTST